MLLGLPHPHARLRNLIHHRRIVRHIRHPGVPARLDLGRIEFLVFVIDPAGPYCSWSAPVPV
jgi:hypothetical protein